MRVWPVRRLPSGHRLGPRKRARSPSSAGCLGRGEDFVLAEAGEERALFLPHIASIVRRAAVRSGHPAAAAALRDQRDRPDADCELHVDEGLRPRLPGDPPRRRSCRPPVSPPPRSSAGSLSARCVGGCPTTASSARSRPRRDMWCSHKASIGFRRSARVVHTETEELLFSWGLTAPTEGNHHDTDTTAALMPRPNAGLTSRRAVPLPRR